MRYIGRCAEAQRCLIPCFRPWKLGPEPSRLEGGELKVFTHPAGLGQITLFLQSLWVGVEGELGKMDLVGFLEEYRSRADYDHSKPLSDA